MPYKKFRTKKLEFSKNILPSITALWQMDLKIKEII
jgi:hypothetical protein